jgi:hypothetical protein
VGREREESRIGERSFIEIKKCVSV